MECRQCCVGKCGAHVGEAGQAQVWLVGAVLAHGVVVGDAREGRGQDDAGGSEGSGAELLDDGEDMLAAREGHFEIDLRELKLAVGALVLIAEAAGDLEVAIEAGDHEDLLEDLRRLWERVELAWMDAAGDKKIASAFGCGFVEDGRFYLEEALLREAFAHGARDFVAQPEVALHLGAAQIDVAIFEADFFVLNGFFRGREGCEARVVEDADLGGLDLDFAGGHFGIDGVGIAEAHLPNGGDDVLGADLFTFQVAFRSQFLVEDDLGDAGAIAEVEEDEVAVVAAAIDPAHEDDLLAGVGGAEVAAHVGAFEST